MNKKAQNSGFALLGFSVVIAIVFFLIGMTALNFIKSSVDTTLTDLGCSDVTISDGAKLTCLGISLVAPYFVLIIFSATGGIIIARIIT